MISRAKVPDREATVAGDPAGSTPASFSTSRSRVGETMEGIASRSLLCYHGEVTDVFINSVALSFVVGSLLVRSILAEGAPLEERLFWLGFFACVASVQGLLAELVSAEGISIVWCALLGLSVQSHLSPAWHPGAAPPSAAEVVCATAAASVGLILLCYYGRTAPPSSTLAHLLAIAAGFGAGVAAQRWPAAALSGSSAVAAAALVTALGLRCRRRVLAARAGRARAARRASEEESRLEPRAQSPVSREPRAPPPRTELDSRPHPHLTHTHPHPHHSIFTPRTSHLAVSQDLAIAHLESQLLRTTAWPNASSWHRQRCPPAARGARRPCACARRPSGLPSSEALGPAVQPCPPAVQPWAPAVQPWPTPCSPGAFMRRRPERLLTSHGSLTSHGPRQSRYTHHGYTHHGYTHCGHPGTREEAALLQHRHRRKHGAAPSSPPREIGEVSEVSSSGKIGGSGEMREMGGLGGSGGKIGGSGEMREMGGLGGSGGTRTSLAAASLAAASHAPTPVESRSGGDEAAEVAEVAEAAELRAALARLRLRERQLCERLDARRSVARCSPFLARPPDLPAAGMSSGRGARRGPFARRRTRPGERKAKSVHPAPAPPQGESPSCAAGSSSSSSMATGSNIDDSLLC